MQTGRTVGPGAHTFIRVHGWSDLGFPSQVLIGQFKLKRGILINFEEPCACSVMSDSLQPHGLQPARLLCPWDSADKNTGVSCHFLPQGVLSKGSTSRRGPGQQGRMLIKGWYQKSDRELSLCLLVIAGCYLRLLAKILGPCWLLGHVRWMPRQQYGGLAKLSMVTVF